MQLQHLHFSWLCILHPLIFRRSYHHVSEDFTAVWTVSHVLSAFYDVAVLMVSDELAPGTAQFEFPEDFIVGEHITYSFHLDTWIFSQSHRLFSSCSLSPSPCVRLLFLPFLWPVLNLYSY